MTRSWTRWSWSIKGLQRSSDKYGMTTPNTFFTIDELCRSSYAIRNGIDNTATKPVKLALIDLIDNVLVPVRLHFNAPVIVTSGYRSPILNKAVGGSATSDHCKGYAADFTVLGYSNLEVCKWIAANLEFKQLIAEFGPTGWIHCSYAAGKNGGDVLTASKVKGKTVYTKGL